MSLADGLAVFLQGGLGNQMFQYAAARALSLEKGLPLALDITALAPPERRTFQLDHFRIAAPVAPTPAIKAAGLIEVHESGFNFDSAIGLAGPGSLLRGYFQSERYFERQAPAIRREFQPKNPLSEHSAPLQADIIGAEFPVAIHVRDSSKDGQRGIDFHGFCAPEYYALALRIVTSLSPQRPSFFVFSDDADFARRQIGEVPGARFITGNDERPWEDIALLSTCASHVIANSSFSWWGSWLGEHPAQIVIAPRAWFAEKTLRSLNLTDLHPKGWILI